MNKMAFKLKFELSTINYHLIIGLVVRLFLSVYSIFHDKYFKLVYTDVDYKVFTAAAQEVVAQKSPYGEETYRYSPVNAYLLTLNVLIHPVFGKIVASVFDVLVAYAIYKIVLHIYGSEKKAVQCAQLWIYNPLPVIISTRGNLDSLSSFFVLLTLFYQLKLNYYASGAFLAISTHLRVYPIIFSLPLFITAGRKSDGYTFKKTYIDKLKFLFSFVATLALLTGVFYYIYGQKFIDQSILYHVYRNDSQHNFSLYFYVQYLDAFVPNYVSQNFLLFDPTITKSLLHNVPQVISLLAILLKYNTLTHLPFNLYASVFVFVAFNKVLTSQYFIWSFSLLPIFLPTITISPKKVFAIIFAWIAAQGIWLLSAYLLEFEGYNTFSAIHASGLLFFFVNIWIITIFINTYNSQYLKKVK